MKIPKYVIAASSDLKAAGFEAFIVGGCVRDFLLGKEPNDWDITTNAKPEELLKVFPKAKYENDFGTVLLPIKEKQGEDLKAVDVLEITTYRSEQGYNDRRHPDTVRFETKIEKDLERRDFTINALALEIDKKGEPIKTIDLFGGEKDIRKRIIRTVGEPEDRFKEDALRLLRALRFYSQLGFEIEPKTERAISKLSRSIVFVSAERIRDELIKILSSERPAEGIMKLSELKLLNYILPELESGANMKQNYHHIYTVFKHNVLSLKYCPSKEWQVRLAALLHDVGKPKSRGFKDGHATFYNHEYIGARITEKIMKRLKFSTADSLRIVNLVKNHMFYYMVGEVTASSVRRLIAKVGRDNLRDLIDLRIADRLGSGLKSAKPYKLRHLEYMLEKVQNDPVSVKMLKINGHDLMDKLKLEPSPKMGAILEVLLGEVLEDPKKNNKKYLLDRAKELMKDNLNDLRQKAKDLIEEKREEEDEMMKRSYGV